MRTIQTTAVMAVILLCGQLHAQTAAEVGYRAVALQTVINTNTGTADSLITGCSQVLVRVNNAQKGAPVNGERWLVLEACRELLYEADCELVFAKRHLQSATGHLAEATRLIFAGKYADANAEITAGFADVRDATVKIDLASRLLTQVLLALAALGV